VFVYQDAIRGESKLTFDAGLASGASPSFIAEPPTRQDQMPSTPTTGLGQTQFLMPLQKGVNGAALDIIDFALATTREWVG
jgi:hypothetical protein